MSATNGRILAVRKVDGEFSGDPVIVPTSLLSKRLCGDVITVSMTDSGYASLQNDKLAVADAVAGSFPPASDVVPMIAETVGKSGKPRYDRIVTISAKLLYDLLPYVCAATHVGEVDQVETQAGGAEPSVVAGDAVAIDQPAVARRGRRRASQRK